MIDAEEIQRAASSPVEEEEEDTVLKNTAVFVTLLSIKLRFQQR